ncbi:unnamed protein product [Zymoseptoria tritici ST99CH_3D7]|uniref:Mannan endo-1,6-alpha-mannosidase n=1 Tax=Zymoseptoria tritici (strain ST99CH_3D7) TaxID=1276538 RepID=A0A1X7RD44_ZYMT9|nr:unnamed protein product [Zymoseptoria tritici ST99CH_3D7]
MRGISGFGLTSLALSAGLANAIDLDVNNRDSVLKASKIVVDNILSVYNNYTESPGGIPGLLPQPYYWYNAGNMFNSLIKYWALSGDQSIVPTLQSALVFQLGPDFNYMPPNQSKSLGNDDQAAWALAAMSAAEYDLPVPNDLLSNNITWASIADTVFKEQVARWDTESCGGGLRWQIFTFNNGYNYKNSISQASFTLLAARLHRFTGNSTFYGEWATRAVEWTRSIGLMNQNGQTFDGTDATTNCSEINRLQWTNNAGLFLATGAYSANATAPNSAAGRYWSELNQQITNSSLRIFVYEDRNIIYEVACEPSNNCNIDQTGFRAQFVRSLATYRDMAPSDDSVSRQNITAVLRASANAAAAACVYGENGTSCANSWYDPVDDTEDYYGQINQNLNALEVFLANLPSGDIKMGDGSANGTGVGGSLVGGANGTERGDGIGSGTGSNNPQSSGDGTGAASTLMVSSTLAVVGMFVELFVLA